MRQRLEINSPVTESVVLSNSKLKNADIV